jgi:hypothetical protein
MNIPQLNKIEEELKRLQALDAHVKKMFDAADKNDFIIGVRLRKNDGTDKEGQVISGLRELSQCTKKENI